MWTSLVAQMVKCLPTMRETQVRFLGWEDPWRRAWQPTPVFLSEKSHGLRSVDHNKLWKILKEMGIPDHLTCLLRNLYADKEATVRTGHGTTDWFQIGKGVRQGCTCLTLLI